MAKRKSFVMHERASGLALGWDLSPFDGEDCEGLGVIDLGVFLSLGFPFLQVHKLDCQRPTRSPFPESAK